MVAAPKKSTAVVFHFPNGFIELVKMQSDITEVIAERIPIKRVGSSWAGICPFHPTQTYDAFRINPQKQLYHCFNCGAAGDVIDFVMQYDKLNFAKAVETLAQRANIALPVNGKSAAKTQAAAQPVSERLWNVAASFYQGVLWSKQGEKALAYLRSRGLSDEVLKRQRVGYAPGGAVLRESLFKQGYSREQLTQAKLLSEKGLDYFWRVITFPVLQAGQVVHFTSRRVGQASNPHVHFRGEIKHLYNEDALESGAPVILVEGIIDCLTLLDRGFPNAVATYGTQGLKAQFVGRFKSVPQVYVCFDYDPQSKAGQQASKKVCSALARAGVAAAPVALPGDTEKVDVNDFFARSKHQPADFQALLDAAKPRFEAASSPAKTEKTQTAAPVAPGAVTQPQPARRRKAMVNDGRVENILERAGRFVQHPALPTGNRQLDEVLNGGLQTGLHLIAAPPSAGKTSFCMQLADTVAFQGVPVLFLSYEQSEFELYCKSLSRVHHIDSRRLLRLEFSKAEFMEMHKTYRPASQHMYHIEAANEDTLEEILELGLEVKGNHAINRLMIVIDYLQIMPTPPRLRDDKQRVDYLVTGLRQLARTLDAPVIAISSLRKGGWDTKGSLGMEELKESASLGYGADVVGILESSDNLLTAIAGSGHLSAADKRVLDDARKRYAVDERLASTFAVLRIIKNRNGERASLLYHYIRAYNEFRPIEREDEQGKVSGGTLSWIGNYGG